MLPEDWDALFKPGISQETLPEEGSEEGPPAHKVYPLPERTYILKPVDGRLRYLRRGRNVPKSEDEAVQEADVELKSVSLHLSRKCQEQGCIWVRF